ncbi:BgTH12-06913 [Blumeria graminis f. sp. triticale]|uniref:BgTH12-06913 n=1 Tax=Blumeria graminis f. sp. triticale TaxID=1689686 RepID=A0A9W4D8C0_BLUGR|nr:BgTH12-06913 [Blumeria graminis f. sp. triticale]
MAESTSYGSLQVLYTDLLALSEERLSSLERLGSQLDAHIEDFRNFLHKNPRNDTARKSLSNGKLEIDGIEYAINEEFQRGAQQLADELDLDELDAAKIFFRVQVDNPVPGQPVLTNAIIQFHQRRKITLDCLRLLCQMSADVDLDELLREDLQSIVGHVISPQSDSKRFTLKCISSMTDIRNWLQRLGDKISGASIVGQFNAETLEVIEYQRVSLIRQHESISTILLYLVRENHSDIADFHHIVSTLKKADKYDYLLVHHIPIISAYISKYGGTDAVGGMVEAQTLHEKLMAQDDKSWTLVYLQAAFRLMWLAEYSGWYSESNDANVPDKQQEEEANHRNKLITEALKDGALDFILSISADVKSSEWHDPARHGLRQWLQRKSPSLLSDTVTFSGFFQSILMEQLEIFVESFITNLPDVLRKLRIDEDEQRQLSKDHDHDLDLERFIVIISYTFEGRPKAAFEGFWDVPDGALVGFVHWASRRASTPLVSAFCEMLQSISEDNECATAAHHFLLEEGVMMSGKMRRAHSLTWNQIFKELRFFSGKIRDYPTPSQSQSFRPSVHSIMLEAEPESIMMLECYLRLITRLCTESEAARTFIAHHPSFNIGELLFQLASSSIGPRLRANAFTTLRSLLSHKTRESGEHIWTALDMWVSGGNSPGSKIMKHTSLVTTTTKGSILQGLASGFEEPNAFVQLLHALVLPVEDEIIPNNSLPFPESLGISIRQPGIDPYVDFAIGEIFGQQAQYNGALDIVQRRILSLTCLDFMATCLETFNENLIILGSQANISIDSAIKASSLQNYVLLHPFSRVMEWMFNEKVLRALFASVHQDPAEAARAEPDSPLILCLSRGLRVITLILELQPTYLDIIRPLLQSYLPHRRVRVSNTSFSSFEDGILNHLSIFPLLGRYCGTGHPELIVSSLRLLEKLSCSPKLSQIPSDLRRNTGRNKAIAALDDDSDTISRILQGEVEAEIDINQGPESPAYIIKLHILDFISSCLQAFPNQPSIAHSLLGFRCGKEGLYIDPQSSFNQGTSLFHAILNLVICDPIENNDGITSWLISPHLSALQVLKELWSAPISSVITIAEMRETEFFFHMFVKQPIIQTGMKWDGIEVRDTKLVSPVAATCLSKFLGRRAVIFQYLSTELRKVSQNHSSSLKQRLLETLMGSTKFEDGSAVDHASVFELFDFMDLEMITLQPPPRITWVTDADISACSNDSGINSPVPIVNLSKLEELLVLKRSELEHVKAIEDPHQITLINTQAKELLEYYENYNQIKIFCVYRYQALKSWVQLILIIIETGNFDDTSKTNFALRALQAIMPRLENDREVVDEVLELAKLAKSLLFSLNFGADCFRQGDVAELVSDRLFHLFQISLRAISILGTKVSLKEWYYNICYRYLAGMTDTTEATNRHRRESLQTIKAAGDKFIDVVCDDASNGETMCRISALLLLTCLVKTSKDENSKYMVHSMTRFNFIGLLVESLREIPQVIRKSNVDEIEMQLSYCHARLALILEISQTRFGAAALCDAGLFHAIHDSGLFSIDLDLGVDLDCHGAVGKYYDLTVAFVRIICSTMLSRGPQNQQFLQNCRQFLTDNRLSILSILKKSAGLGFIVGISPNTIEDLTDLYLLLISYTNFLEVADPHYNNTNLSSRGLTSFT